MTSPRSNYPYARLFSQENKGSETKERKKQDVIKYDYFFPVLGSYNVTTGTQGIFDIGSLRQPLNDFCCCFSFNKLRNYLFVSNIEPHSYAKTARRKALDISEIPLYAANACAMTVIPTRPEGCCKCVDVSCCICICCFIRLPTYVVKSICCSVACIGGAVSDAALGCKTNGPDAQSMENESKTIEHFKYGKGHESYWELPNAEFKSSQDLEKFEQELVKFFKNLIKHKDYREDILVSKFYQNLYDIFNAIILYDGKNITINERIQILAYIKERGGFTETTSTKLAIDSLIFANYYNVHLVLDFVLASFEKPDRHFYVYPKDELDLFYQVNPQRARLKAFVFQKYNFILPGINEFAKEYQDWLQIKTTLEMGRHPRLGRNSNFFKLPKEIFVSIQEFHDGIPRIKRQ